ncbi:hypothetical protein QJQ45_018281 [Haematococcus lacustris]|nr:hypothetical protein QJQ45_018281 [Haematococcus lacustris]
MGSAPPLMQLAQASPPRLLEQLQCMLQLDWAAPPPAGPGRGLAGCQAGLPQALLSGQQVAELRQVVEEVRGHQQRQAGSSAGGSGPPGPCEVPEEFLDPLTCVLMRQPVRLPDSGIVMDRSTIERHLMTHATDPYSRQPLALEEVVTETALEQRIREWRNQQG